MDMEIAKEMAALLIEVSDFACDQGHTWKGHDLSPQVLLLPAYVPGSQQIRSGPTCPFCVVEWLAQVFPAHKVEKAVGG